jgi:hypothetical protein
MCFNASFPEPITTSYDRSFAVFCGPGPWSLGSEAFRDQSGFWSVQKRQENRTRTGLLSTNYGKLEMAYGETERMENGQAGVIHL